MIKLTRLSLIMLVILLSGCAQFTLQKPGKVTVVGNMTVEVGKEWSRLATDNYERWTVDGLGLQELIFNGEIEDGDAILKGDDKEKLPKYKSGMTPIEVAEAIQAALAIREFRKFRILKLRPFRLGGKDGFRFEFSHTNKEGLDLRGFVAGAVREKKLSLIIYVGARLHYHDKHKDEAEHIVKSVQFL